MRAKEQPFIYSHRASLLILSCFSRYILLLEIRPHRPIAIPMGQATLPRPMCLSNAGGALLKQL